MLLIIGIALVVLAAAWSLYVGFAREYRAISPWIRHTHVALSTVLFCWSVLTLVNACCESRFPPSARFPMLSGWVLLTFTAIILTLRLQLSAESRGLWRQSRVRQWLYPD